jgi:hypothetical protein
MERALLGFWEELAGQPLGELLHLRLAGSSLAGVRESPGAGVRESPGACAGSLARPRVATGSGSIRATGSGSTRRRSRTAIAVAILVGAGMCVTTASAWAQQSSTATITSGPSGTVPFRDATVEFVANEPTDTFMCSLDGSAFAACSSPVLYQDLAVGAHTFTVAAVDVSGFHKPNPPSRNWTIGAVSVLATTHVERLGFRGVRLSAN